MLARRLMNLLVLLVAIVHVNVFLCLKVNLPVIKTQVYMYLFQIKEITAL